METDAHYDATREYDDYDASATAAEHDFHDDGDAHGYTDDDGGEAHEGHPHDEELVSPLVNLTLQSSSVADTTPLDALVASTSTGEYPIFKVGECVSRARGVASCSKCDQTNGHVYIGCSTGELILFDFTSQQEVWRRRVDVDGRPLHITCVDIRGTRLALGGAQGETVIYDLATFTVQQTWRDHTKRVSAVAWVPGDDAPAVVYSTSHDGYFLARDADRKGKIIHSFITCTCPLSALQVESPSVVYVGSWDGQVKKIDLDRKQVLLVMKASQHKESPIRSFALAPVAPVKKKKKAAEADPTAFILVISHGIGEIQSWDMRTGKVHVASYHGCGDVVNSMCTWNGKLYAAGDDRFVRIFDIDSGVCIESLSGHENGVTSVAVCGVTPVITPEMEEAAASAAATQRTASRKGDRVGSAAPPPQQGVGNELLLTTGFDGQSRAYKLAAIEAALQLKLLKLEEQKAAAFENFIASKAPKSKKGKAGSRKGSAKKKSGGSSKKKKAASGDGSKKKKKGSAKKSPKKKAK